MRIAHPIDPIEQQLWNYAHSRIDDGSFEPWVYETTGLEGRLEPDDYMRLLETDYRDVSKRASYERRLMVREIVEKAFPRPCLCLKLEDKAWSSMGEPSLLRAHGVRLARLTPWIELVQCTVCGTNWLHGANTDSGSYVATRLSSEQARLIVDKDAWPDAYDRIEHLWPDEGFLRWQKCASLEDWRRQNPVLPGDRCF